MKHGSTRRWQGRWWLAVASVVAIGTAVAQEAPPAAAPAPAPEPIPQPSPAAVQAELGALFAGVAARHPGSPGNLKLATEVAQRFAASGFPHGTIGFDAPVFLPGTASLALPDGSSVPLQYMHPTLLRPGNFTEAQFEAPLVYLGRGTNADLERVSGVSLTGALVLMDFACADQWLRFLRFGVRGFVFLGAPTYEYVDSVGKVYNTEVNTPRFFVNAADGARLQALAQGAGTTPVRVQVQNTPARWATQSLSDHWVLIPGADPKLGNEVVVLTAPLDANAVVPELAQGGQSAPNLLLLLQLLDDCKTRPPTRSLLLVAVNAHTQHHLGERTLAWYLLARASDVENVRNLVAKEMRTARLFADKYRLLKLEKVDAGDGKLDPVMEMLWELDKRQQTERRAVRAKLVAEREAEVKRRKAAGEDIKELQDHPIPPLDEVLDLTPFDDAAYPAAVAAARARLETHRHSVMTWLMSTAPVRAQFDQQIATVVALQAAPAAELRALAAKYKTVFDDEKTFEDWRTLMDDSTGTRLAVKTKLQGWAKRNLNILKMNMLDVIQKKDLSASERDAKLATMKAEREDLATVLVLFNKLDVGLGRMRTHYRQIAANERQRALLADYRDYLVKRYSRWTEVGAAFLKRDGDNNALLTALGQRRVALVLTLELNYGTEHFGFCSVDRQVRNDWKLGFAKLSMQIAGQLNETRGETAGPLADTMTMLGGRPEGHYFYTTDTATTYFHLAQSTPALALLNTYGDFGRSFGPDDTLAQLDAARVTTQLNWLRAYVPALIAHPDLTLVRNLAKPDIAKMQMWSSLIRTYKLDEFEAQTTPSLEVPNTLVAAYRVGNGELIPPLIAGDVVNCYSAISDETGILFLLGMDEPAVVAPIAYQMDANFTTVLHTIDRGRIQDSEQLITNIVQNANKTFPLFPCTEFVVGDRLDSSQVASSGAAPILSQLWPNSAKMKAQPQKYGAHGIGTLSKSRSHLSRGPVSVFMERRETGELKEPLILLSSHYNILANPTTTQPDGAGFERPQELGRDFFHRASTDLDKLNHFRVDQMKGVTNQLVVNFMNQSRKALDQAEEKKKEKDHVGFLQASALALGSGMKAYLQSREMTNDMLKAIIFYMALMVPFCFFVMKLVFKLVRLEHQVMVFAGLFVCTYLGFRFIHPAFRIALNPEAIFIAFLLLAVGVFITWVMHARFEGEMQLLFHSFTGMEADVGYSTVGQTAMMIGVNNMKRRRIRTTLTTATIVLVTFAMLAFSSVSKTMSPTIITKADQAPYTGFFFHRAGGGTMDEEVVEVFRNLFAGRAEVVVRRILQSPKDASGNSYPWRMEVVGSEQGLDIAGVVGLPMADKDFLGPLPLVQGQFFSAPDAAEAILSVSSAQALQLTPADLGKAQVRLRGRQFTVVGIVDDDRYRMRRDFNPQLPLMPLGSGQAGGQGAAEAGPAGDQEDAVSALPIDTASMLVLPAETLRLMGGKAATVSIRFPDGTDGKPNVKMWQEVNRLLVATRVYFYVGSQVPFKLSEEARQEIRPGVYFVGSNFRTSIGGVTKLLIPLLIAGSIILNTMLGTVYERKSEIAIYNAIGLNPTHIFLFFLAEAFVYSVIGSVGGYLIGQILALTIQRFDLVPGININFSSLMVVYAILFTITLVLLSTLYPASVATRTAVPSGKRKWSLPPHDGQRMVVAFPFIYQPDLAQGVMFYLYEYFARFSEKSLGDQIATLEKYESGVDDQQRPTYTLIYSVALAPFDLGVTQMVRFQASYEQIVQSYRVNMTINRSSGQDTNWVTTNKPFLEKLRTVLIRWRNLDPTQHAWYVQMAGRLYRGEDVSQVGRAPANQAALLALSATESPTAKPPESPSQQTPTKPTTPPAGSAPKA